VATDPVSTDVWGSPDFSDEFSLASLGQDWSQRLQGYSKASKRKCSKADPSAVKVRRGTARLSVIKDPDRTGTKCRYEGDRYAWRLNGAIDTQSSSTGSLRYGYAAARIKFQPRRGQHASFWLQPKSRDANEGSARDTGAEMDVIEWFGEDQPQGGLASFIYYYPDNGQAGVTAKKVGGYIRRPGRFGRDWAGKYHVFAVEWTPHHYVFRIDGKEAFRTKQGVSGQPQYLILSLLSSDYELKHLGGDRHLPQTMSVDWVRFWKG
jgi:beta-glucanase (GH16 family)